MKLARQRPLNVTQRTFRACSIALAVVALQLLVPVIKPVAVAQEPTREANAVRVRLIPDRPFVERDERGLYLNCDFRVENQTGDRIRLTHIEVFTLDTANRISSRRFLSERGSLSPGLETLPRREIDSGAVVDIFNPFHTLDPRVPTATLRFEFEFRGRQRYDAAVKRALRNRFAAALPAVASSSTIGRRAMQGPNTMPSNSDEDPRSMYPVNESDRVTELAHVPHMSAGAPNPIVLADEQMLLLAYMGREVPTGTWMPGPTVLVEFEAYYAYMHGPRNDEALTGHPLAARGLAYYRAFEVKPSSWVHQPERMNRVHPLHDPARYERLRHFVFTFHDSTFECVAEGFSTSVRAAPLGAVVPEMVQRLTAR